ncbi:hypothetical protein ACA910_004097 [Epithemia clementina (nom. ined.)]
MEYDNGSRPIEDTWSGNNNRQPQDVSRGSRNNNNDVMQSMLPSSWSFPIQRFLLVHFGLREIATGEAVADESSSLEEMALPILYEYSASAQSSFSDTEDFSLVYAASAHADNNVTATTLSTIELYNLALALYTLPFNLLEEEHNNSDCHNNNQKKGSMLQQPHLDTTRLVELENATLVFQPVEEEATGASPNCKSNDILMIIQLAKTTRTQLALRNQLEGQETKKGEKQQHETNVPGPQPRNYARVTPQAVAAALKRHHDLFSLLRGGGIHTRMHHPSQNVSAAPSSSSSSCPQARAASTCVYPGMDRLFRLLSKTRKVRERIERLSKDLDHLLSRTSLHGESRNDQSNHIDSTIREHEKQLMDLHRWTLQLHESLPLSSLKRDLKQYYDGVFSEWQNVSAMGLAAGRCLVELVPPPPPCTAPSRSRPQQQAAASAYISIQDTGRVESMRLAMEQFMFNISSATLTPIHTVSMFLKENATWLFTATTTTVAAPSMPQIALLLSYMTKIQARAAAVAAAAGQRPSSPWKMGQSAWSSLWSTTAAASPNMKKQSNHDYQNNSNMVQECAAFVPPPPLSLFSAGEKVESLTFSSPTDITEIDDDDDKDRTNNNDDPTLCYVWAPRVYGLWVNEDETRTPATKATMPSSCRMCLYQWNDTIQFLFFLSDNQDREEESKEYYDALLRTLNAFMRSILPNIFGGGGDRDYESKDKANWLERRTWRGEGQDILLINRTTNQVVLYSNKRRSSSSGNQRRHLENQQRQGQEQQHNLVPNMESSRQTNQGLGNHPTLQQPEASFHDKKASSNQRQRSPVSSYDIRHELASQIGSLDTSLAVEEAMMELASATPRGTNDVELCTSLPRHWLWASRRCCPSNNHDTPFEDVELYILLDAAVYVTVSDMQTAVSRIRNEYFHPLFG